MAPTRRALILWGLKAGSVVGCLSPVLGLGLFWWLPFKPAVTVYVLITGLAFALLKWIEFRRLSLELDEILKGRYHLDSSKEKISGGVKWLR